MSAVIQKKDWPFVIHTLSPALGAEIRGVDLAQPVDAETFAAIYQAFLDYQLLSQTGPLCLV